VDLKSRSERGGEEKTLFSSRESNPEFPQPVAILSELSRITYTNQRA